MNEGQFVFEAFKVLGPASAVAAVLYAWVRAERAEKKVAQESLLQLQNKILENAIAQTAANSKFESSIAALKEVLSQVLTKLLRQD